MNDAMISCPQCRAQFPLTEVMRQQLADDVRSEIQSELGEERDRLNAERTRLETVAAEIETSRKSIDEQVEMKLAEARRLITEKESALQQRQSHIDDEVAKKVAADRQKLAQDRKELISRQEQLEAELNTRIEVETAAITQKLRAEVEEQFQVELKGKENQIAVLNQRVKDTTAKELALLKQKQEFEEKQQTMELEIARTLDQERSQIRQEAIERASEEHELKLKEREQIIDQMRRQIDDLKRKAEQGSQQLQGEVMEVELETLLGELFPGDLIEAVAKGVNGGDVLQTVRDTAGRSCGKILWESKRTKTWQPSWLPKLRQDQRNAKADCCAIVSAVLPDGAQTMGLIDDVWITNWRCVSGLVTALRAGVITAAHARLALEGHQGKMELVYNYLSSPQFCQRVQGIVEAFQRMQTDLTAEKRALTAHWTKREKQLEQALVNTAGLYGDLQGIIGGQLQKIEGMDLGVLDTTVSKTPKLPANV